MFRNTALIGLLLASAAWAQEEPVFRATTRLVQVGVVAQDKSGRSVTGLKAADFRLKDGGKSREIRLFAVNQSNGQAVPTGNDVASTFANTATTQNGSGSVTVIVMDYLNTPRNSQPVATRELVRYLQTVKPDDHLAIYSIGPGGLRLLHDYTADASSMVAILAKHKGEIEDPGGDSANPDSASVLARLLTGKEQARSLSATTGELASQPLATLAAFERIAHILDGIPVRKNLVWISGGFGAQQWGNAGATALTGRAPAIMQAPAWAGHDSGVRLTDSMDGTQSYSRAIDSAMRRFNGANVAVYPISARGLTARVPGPEQSKIVETALDAREQNMISIAEATGGLAFVGTNNIHEAIQRALSAPEVTYTLGFYAETTPARDRFHRIEVTLVNNRAISLRYRKGYEDNLNTQSDGAVRKASLDSAGWSPLDANAIPLTAKLEEGTGLSLQIGIAGVELELKGDRRSGTLDVLLVQRDQQGNEYQRVNDTIFMDFKPATFERVLKTGVPYRHQVRVNPKARYVRVVVRDGGTGNIGSLTIPLRGSEDEANRPGQPGR